jgi:hypothetical protein
MRDVDFIYVEEFSSSADHRGDVTYTKTLVVTVVEPILSKLVNTQRGIRE